MLRIDLDQHTYNLAHSELVRELNSPSINAILKKFPSTSLQVLSEMGLDNRMDAKFVLPKNIFGEILAHLSTCYAILTIDKKNIFTYENTYFDTEERFFYHSHHNGKLNRQKLRFRRYKESDLRVLETKLKTNKSRTIKQRISVKESNPEHINHFLNEQIHLTCASLWPKLFNNYHRMTFIHLQKKEKITLDFNLSFQNPDTKQDYHIDDYFVVEVKTRDKAHRSEFFTYCKERNIRENRFSKYCMGTCLTNGDELKKNNFKQKLSLFS